MKPLAVLLAVSALLAMAAEVAVVTVGTTTYIALNLSSIKYYNLNFSAVAIANDTGVYVLANPPSQRISCWAGGWYNRTGAVKLPPGSKPVCFFPGLNTPVYISPVYASYPAMPLAQYAWILAVAATAAPLLWRRIEVAGLFSMAFGALLPTLYPLFGLSPQTAIAMAVLLIAAGAALVAMSKRGE